MSQAILASISPESVVEIIYGRKTAVLRKSAPKCDFPVDVYVYCAKRKFHNLYRYNDMSTYDSETGGFKRVYEVTPLTPPDPLNGKIVAKFTMNAIEKVLVRQRYRGLEAYTKHLNFVELQNRTRLPKTEIIDYLKGRVGYVWSVSDAVVLRRPMGLDEFHKAGYMSSEYEDSVSDMVQDYFVNDIPFGDNVPSFSCPDEYDVWKECEKELAKEYRIERAPRSWMYVESLLGIDTIDLL